MAAKVTLGGEPIALKVGDALHWTLAYGVRPSQFDLETSVDSARRIASLAKTQVGGGNFTGPLDLMIEDGPAGRKVEVKGLYVTAAEKPGADYNTRVLTLSDQRWLWDRVFIERSYNIRRKTGQFRLLRDELAPVQLNRQRPDFTYRASTLKGTGEDLKPWTATEVLEDVLTELCGKGGFVIDAKRRLGRVDSIEGLELHDSGPDALLRVLSFIPGARVYIGYDGKCHVGSIYDGSEIPVFEAFAPGNAGDWTIVDKSQIRPAGGYTVFSDQEVELRFDYDETRKEDIDTEAARLVGGVLGNAAELVQLTEPRYIENVIINPLYSLQLEEGENPRFASLGEPIPVDDFIRAFNLTSFNRNALPNFNPAFPQRANISKDRIRKAWFGEKWGLLRTLTCLNTAGLFNPERLKLLQALRAGWRSTYRILPQWRDKIRAISADRAAILDWETGTRAPASVFTEYIARWSQLGYDPKLPALKLGTVTNDYADDVGAADKSPFMVEIIDSDMALFRVVPKVDQDGLVVNFELGGPNGPLPAPDKRNAVVYWQQVDLAPRFKLAVILTAMQDTPNDTGRLHAESVSVKEAAQHLGLASVPEARGRSHELAQTAETARFAWRDSDREAIEQSFFEGEERPRTLGFEGRLYPVGMVNPGDIRAISVATAASALSAQLDKAEGYIAGPLSAIAPTGNLRTVTHSVVMGQGNKVTLFTTLTAPSDVPEFNTYALLPEGVRRKIRRLVQP